MRPYGLILFALILTGLSVRAQQASQAPAPPADKTLDEHLKKWEKAMTNIETLGAQLTRIDKDHTFDQVQRLTGVAYYMKVGKGPSAQNLALLEMKLEGHKEAKEKYICTGTYIYKFVPEQKEIHYYELRKPEPGQADEDSLMSLLFGMKADDAKRRYELKLAKEDAYYIYVEITPRRVADRNEFSRARLVLNKSNYLPRQLWFEYANKNEVTWDLPNLQVGMSLNRRAFDAPTTPPGWKLVPGENRRQTVRPAGSAPSAPAAPTTPRR